MKNFWLKAKRNYKELKERYLLFLKQSGLYGEKNSNCEFGKQKLSDGK